MGDIPSVSKSFFNFLPVFRICGTHQIFPLKFFQNGFADQRDKFTDGHSSVASPLLSLQYQGITHGFCRFLLLLGGGRGDAGWAGAGFCCRLCLEIMMYKNIFNSIKTKGPSSGQAVALDVFLSSLKFEMNGTSQGGGGVM